ncbi:MAG: hypothetical protein AB7D35_05000 [Bacteroidales bacterium]|jgi:hypothetical protein
MMKKSGSLTMTKYLLIFLFAFAANYSYGVEVPIYGKAGVEINNGNIKICPGFAFNKCASISVSWQEIWDYITNSDGNEPPFVSVTFYDADGNETMAKLLQVSEIDLTNLNENHAPEFIIGDRINFK